jgi:4-amino-4-deoxy-L-arabinose transferase-like glycosyltransferase
VVVLVLVLVLAFCAVRLLAQAAAGRPARVLAVAAIAFAYAVCWSLVTPPFEGPDEPAHVAYVQYLAETSHAPCQSCARPRYSSQERLALRGVAADAPRGHGGGPSVAATHAPPYYGLAALGYATGGSLFDRLAAMRLVSALLGALTAAMVLLTARELLPGRPLPALLAGLVVAFQPTFAFVSGAVNNDNGVNAVMAVLAYLLVRALRRGLTPGLAAGIGTALVLAPLMKLTGYVALAPTLVALAVLAARSRARARLAAWAVLAVGAAGLAVVWSLRSGQRAVLTHLAHDPLGFLSDRWPVFEIYVKRGFAAFGMDFQIRFPNWVYAAIAVALLAVLALAVRALLTHRAAARALRAEIAVLVVLGVAVVLASHLAFFGLTSQARALGEQGRYAFAAMATWGALVAAASFGLGARREHLLSALMLTSMVGVSAAALLLALTGFYA